MRLLSKNYDLATLRMLASIVKVSGDLALVKYQQFIIDKIDYYIVQHRELVRFGEDCVDVDKSAAAQNEPPETSPDAPSKKKKLFSFKNAKNTDKE